MRRGHHRLDATAVLSAVQCSPRAERPHERALGWLRPRVPRGLRALMAPPRSANDRAHVMAGLIAAVDPLLRVKGEHLRRAVTVRHKGRLPSIRRTSTAKTRGTGRGQECLSPKRLL
jgi:hypothetical protein